MVTRTIEFRIPEAGLEVYLVDGSKGVNWNPTPSRLFRGEEGKYTLTVQGAAGTEFKSFVWIRTGQDATEVRKALEKSGFKITGEGDVFEGRIRLWFLVPNLEDTNNGVWSNNVWDEEDKIVFPRSEDDRAPGKQTARPTPPPPEE